MFIGGSTLEVRCESDPGEGRGRIVAAMKSCLPRMMVSTRIVTVVSVDGNARQLDSTGQRHANHVRAFVWLGGYAVTEGDHSGGIDGNALARNDNSDQIQGVRSGEGN